ncbi:methylisocitrate lyase [Schumannella luteola]|uniref:Methylisocitrate lyase n=1 Tax=Schumannella luteola TaxID=472059 RepID=A0A852YIA6_9MICO|nr:methylisocitrate lyase [Schumannella luteola]NYG97509.1 methylisocitrate lyase [Schumannella luteola]TPX01532.1 methylisocitrate lyase [Schumannella luteola]
MLQSTLPPHEKRAAFREALASGKLLRLPGAFNPLSAQLIQEKGFEGVYVSGAVLSADLGLPDIGLTTLTEVSQRAGQIARVTDLPTLVDADTGFGEPMNVARTVQLMEDAGVAGIHIEDQVNPKRCGHLDGKEVVDESTALKRIAAAAAGRRDANFLIMARTDIRGVAGGEQGLRDAVDRAKALVDAGADAIFPEAMATLEEFAAIRAAVDVPVLANMTEFGKSELFTVSQLESVGVNLVIFPVSLLRLAMGAAERGLDALGTEGSLQSQVPSMQTRARLYELVDYSGYSEFDAGIFTFDLGNNRQS